MHLNKLAAANVYVMGEDSKQLLRKAQAGDMDAFAELFEELRMTVFSVACRLVGPVDADDVVMDTFLKAWKAIPKFRRTSSLKTWLYRLTYNCALDLIRSRNRRQSHIQPAPQDGPDPLAAVPDKPETQPDERIAQSELAQRINQALTHLSDEHRVTLGLRFSDGLSYAEIAAATAVSIGTVMSRLFNAKKKLRRILEAEGLR